jgi:hypothetical protein
MLCLLLAWTCPISQLAIPSYATEEPANETKAPNKLGNPSRIAVAGFIGYGLSHFEEQSDWGGTSYLIPAGLQLLLRICPRLSIGAELNQSIRPFSWDVKPGIEKIAEWSVTQTAISALLKYEGSTHGRRPHARAGFGLYLSTGKSEFEAGWGNDYELSYKPGFGGSAGLGLTADWGRSQLYMVEVVYHVSYRRVDEDGANAHWHNHLAIQVAAGVNL